MKLPFAELSSTPGVTSHTCGNAASWFATAALFMAIFLHLGCSPGHHHGPHSGGGHGHVHVPPHGGTAVILGNEEYHIEFVLEPATGGMQAFILDGHMDQFVRIGVESFEVTAQAGGQTQTLVFKAVESRATGETVGNSSTFSAQADWLKEMKSFDAELKAIAIRGKKYEAVGFKFP